MPGPSEVLGTGSPIMEDFDLGYSVLSQKLDLDFDFPLRSLKGKTDIKISPHTQQLKSIRLNCRQCQIKDVTVDGKPAPDWEYRDPYQVSKLNFKANVSQYHMLQNRIDDNGKPELVINLPKFFRINELSAKHALESVEEAIDDPSSAGFTDNQRSGIDGTPSFAPIVLSIVYKMDSIRDGMQFVGWEEDDLHYPHAYTQGTSGLSRCIFPCVDTVDQRCSWEISIRTPRTVGDAFRSLPGLSAQETEYRKACLQSYTDQDKSLDLTVLCSGYLTDEIVDKHDPNTKITIHKCTVPVGPQHIGFAIGPFESFDLTSFREVEGEEKLGTKAVPVTAYCLPGRVDEAKNTCYPVLKAVDFFSETFGRFPFSSYKMCFLDNMAIDHVETATLSLCSNRLLYPENVIDPIYRVSRALVYSAACQWIGVDIIPKDETDTWVIVGMAYYITDAFLKKLFGNNESRYQQKIAMDKLVELDMARPSIHESGKFVELEPSQLEFIELKAPLVLFILDRRLMKGSGSLGLQRVVTKICLNSSLNQIPNGALDTDRFMTMCEKHGHVKLESFFNQWVFGAGCPRFRVTQRFNKKKLVVEMLISQQQNELPEQLDLQAETFMRDVKEEVHEVYASGIQNVFTGPMTIRIHEADGTPYEHIVEIKEANTRFEIPYNTKYKRLKRSRRQKERIMTGAAADFQPENTEDVLLYCLGDVLQTEAEMREWKLGDWSKEEEDKMSQESYEWIRMDADFEWICKMNMGMAGYMWVSQLQQDRDVVAQLESVQYLMTQKEHPLVSTFLVRTLMDPRYFHGIRTTAALALARQAKDEIGWRGFFHLERAFQELFCYADSRMTKCNDFSDRSSYYIQCTIPQAVARIRDNNGRAPYFARSFLYEKLRYNDNSGNDYSDSHYIAGLIRALAEAVASAPPVDADHLMMDTEIGDDIRFHKACLEEIDRYRRIDEWIPSFHNILSRTALECNLQMAKSGCIPANEGKFLQYTQEGCEDNLRIIAFSCLMELGGGKNSKILPWFLLVLGTDPSPYVRYSLLHLLGKTLGSIAIGDDKTNQVDIAQRQDGLVIEAAESSTEARAAELSRRRSVSGALVALKDELQSNTALATGLWSAIESPIISLHELQELLEICNLLYDPSTRQIVVLKYPRFWTSHNLGRGTDRVTGKPTHVVKFSQTRRIRYNKVATVNWSKYAVKRPIILNPPKPPTRSPAKILTPAAPKSRPSVPPAPLIRSESKISSIRAGGAVESSTPKKRKVVKIRVSAEGSRKISKIEGKQIKEKSTVPPPMPATPGIPSMPMEGGVKKPMKIVLKFGKGNGPATGGSQVGK